MPFCRTFVFSKTETSFCDKDVDDTILKTLLGISFFEPNVQINIDEGFLQRLSAQKDSPVWLRTEPAFW